jgi:hypothetical protein
LLHEDWSDVASIVDIGGCNTTLVWSTPWYNISSFTRSSTHVHNGGETVTFETSPIVDSETLRFENDV